MVVTIKIKSMWKITSQREHLELMSRMLNLNIVANLMKSLCFRGNNNYTRRLFYIEKILDISGMGADIRYRRSLIDMISVILIYFDKLSYIVRSE